MSENAFEAGDLHVAEGITLRDYFAAAALARFAERPDWYAREKDGARGWFGRVAADCYAAADAMLVARGVARNHGPSAETLARECKAAVEQTGNVPRKDQT